MKKTTAIILVSGILLLQVGCQPVTPIETTVPETTIVETQPLTSEETTPATTTAKPTPTMTPTPKPTVPPETTVETTPAATTTATTTAPTPKPTKAPVETTAATTTATTAAPTEPPPTTTAAPTYTENPAAIRDLIIQYCKDNGRWTPDAEKSGDSSVQWNVGDLFSDSDYATIYINGKIKDGSFSVVSVSCWIDGTKLYIAHETCMNP